MNNDKHFWDTQWFLWFSLIFIYPVGLALLWFNTDCDTRLKKWMSVIFGAFFLFVCVGGSGNNESASVTEHETKPAASTATTQKTEIDAATTPVDEEITVGAFPENLDGVKPYLVSVIGANFKNQTIVDISPSTNTPNGYLVEVTTSSDKLSMSQCKVMARNTIVAAYDAIYEKNLPIIYVSFKGENTQGKRLMQIGIGKNIAEKMSRDKWKINSGKAVMSADEFSDFARKNQNQAISSDGKTHFEDRCFFK